MFDPAPYKLFGSCYLFFGVLLRKILSEKVKKNNEQD
jgi:hypothetical protein